MPRDGDDLGRLERAPAEGDGRTEGLRHGDSVADSDRPQILGQAPCLGSWMAGYRQATSGHPRAVNS
jgi:hypothetical protein